eukprot:365787-Chlamydomonas_euryale.AAC.10
MRGAQHGQARTHIVMCVVCILCPRPSSIQATLPVWFVRAYPLYRPCGLAADSFAVPASARIHTCPDPTPRLPAVPPDAQPQRAAPVGVRDGPRGCGFTLGPPQAAAGLGGQVGWPHCRVKGPNGCDPGRPCHRCLQRHGM